ncbi:uncharacterized protein LOC120312019 isoform X1 [Crotalus tigris]|uniref:uncharacterized protein LOC120312019 isoform X1 n=2 Tax=Crotalus tigris TaxID=88082 RepID=UPI00192F8DB5|nr:uncharacterized protein LOC120312019 isoform X1 [Crotalus tigris]XP_039208150.1 uncharacterized protein LOC120312019 isoform X1 [Crotalus tigris]
MATLPNYRKPSKQRTSQLAWLLAAHLASSYFVFVQAQKKIDFTILVTPRYPFEGHNVSLIPQAPPNGTISCLWTKGENKTEILMYYPSNHTFEPLFGFHSGHLPLEDCILFISNLSYLDMGMYGIIQTLPKKTLYGEGFLMITRESIPRKKNALGAGIIAGISAGCLIGVLLVIGLVTYQTRGFSLRSATTAEPAGSSPTQEASTNKETNQPGANKQTQEAEGNKM